MLGVTPDRDPTMIVPILERPDAEAAPSASGLHLVDWRDGANPYEAAAALLDPHGRTPPMARRHIGHRGDLPPRAAIAIRDGNLVTGQQNFSGAETARLILEAVGR